MQIDVYHDIACPWCRIGKRNLAAALAEWNGEPVQVRYRTFFLNPDIPAEGYDFRAYMRAKGGGNPDLEMWFDAPRQAGKRVGLTFNFDTITHAPNTLLAHRLIALTPDAQRTAMIDALYDAYFEHGQNVGDIEVLLRIAAGQGLDAESLRQQLASGAAEEAVLAEADFGVRLGVSGVPLFVFNEQYALSGAQPAHVLKKVMDQVAAGVVATR
ncbi:MAG: DsbA family oxidoreductase [Chloroflexota bacterium]|nr:DsbA family oxidoreductase [Chloroflexota bacterium]